MKFLVMDGLSLGYHHLLLMQVLTSAVLLATLIRSLAEGADLRGGLRILMRFLASSLITSVAYVILLLAGLFLLRRNASLVHIPGTVAVSTLTTYGLMKGVKYEWEDLRASAVLFLLISVLLGLLNPPVSTILLLPMVYSLSLARPSSKVVACFLCAFQFLSIILLCAHALMVGGGLGLLMVCTAPLVGVFHSLITSPLAALAGLTATILALSCAEAMFYIAFYRPGQPSG